MRSAPGGALAVLLLGTWACRAPSAPPRSGDERDPAPLAASDPAVSAGNDATAAAPTPQEPGAPVPQDAPAAAAGADTGLQSAAGAPLVADDGGGLDLSGSLTGQWRARKSGDAHDQDVYGVLGFDVGDASQDSITGHFLGRISADIDGQGDADSQQVFGSLQDTYGEAAHVDLYEASVDFHRPFDAPLTLRAGRQIDYATPEFAHFDGVRVESEPLGGSKLVAGAYGGVPVRLYDATSIADQIVGAWAEARPWTGGRVRGDWMYLHQDAQPSDYDNDLLGLSVWQRVGAHVLVDAGYSMLEEESRDVRLRATYDDGEGDLMVQAGYYRLLNPQADFAYEFDPYYATLQEYQPFGQYRLLVSKALTDTLRLDLGGDLRDLENEDDESRLNHGYERAYATFVIADILTRGLDLSLTGDTWNSDEQDIDTWGVDLTWAPDSTWRASAGSSYALYKYDVALDEERDDVRVWYVRLRRKLDSAWTIDLAYEYEDDDYDDYHEILAGATWHF